MDTKHIGVTTLTFQGQWRHQSRNHWTRDSPFPIGAPLSLCSYL